MGPNVIRYKDSIDIQADVQDYDITELYVKNQ